MSARIDELKQALEKNLGDKATHITSTAIREIRKEDVFWEGVVATFDLALNPKTKRWLFGERWRSGNECQ